jgi:hypothetical protein
MYYIANALLLLLHIKDDFQLPFQHKDNIIVKV